MNTIAKVVGPLALGATVIPPLLFLLKMMSEPTMKGIMLAAALAWFIFAPLWLKGGEE